MLSKAILTTFRILLIGTLQASYTQPSAGG